MDLSRCITKQTFTSLEVGDWVKFTRNGRTATGVVKGRRDAKSVDVRVFGIDALPAAPEDPEVGNMTEVHKDEFVAPEGG